MKIVFICGCLEPAMDGVGDYVRKIAGTLKSKGHHVSLISLKDKFTKVLISEIGKNSQSDLSVYRIPEEFSPRHRYSIMSKLVNELKPEWISLQYVGFSYDKYGLPLGLPFYLRDMTRNIKLHITLHELWCGMDTYSKWKEKILGFFQKIYLRLFISRVKPQLIFTSIDSYRDELSLLGIRSIVTPVFGNIPINEFGPDDIWNTYKHTSELDLITEQPDNWIVITFFGTVYLCPGLDQLLTYTLEAAKKRNQKLAVISVGHNRLSSVGELLKSFRNTKYFPLGTLSFELINRIFKMTTFGVMTSPANRLNKSGSGMAMLERGIPILISPLDKSYRNEMVKNGIYQALGSQNILSALSKNDRLSKQNSFTETANSYSNLDVYADGKYTAK